jgi:VIT1/CCC1 family predicted Fe2+/Mn2+ transporter
VAGADPAGSLYVLTGTAGLLAGACSMAAGEYVSVRTQRELQEYQIRLERAELERYPEEEAEELALIYSARGLGMEEARAFARRLMRDPEAALETLTREELGIDPGSLGSPLGAAVSSFLAFAIGALLPLLPFLLGVESGVTVMVVLAAGSLFAVGATLSLFTGRGALQSGLRMLGIGGAAGVLTWALGALLGVSAG